MVFFKENLKRVKALIFDVDGVLSADSMVLDELGVPVRTANVKDGYAMRNALNMGYRVAIITGGNLDRVRVRYENLGVEYIYMGVRDKLECLHDFLEKTGIAAENTLFMGDDLIDYQIMKSVGVPVCPMDAVSEIKEISAYISDRKGGEGCARDIIEQVMKAQNTWINEHSFFWRST